MNIPRPPNPLNTQIRAEASEWLLRFSEGEVDPAGREEFSYWLRISPEHVRAYLRVAAFWQEAGKIDGKQAPRDIEALVAHARQEANIFPLALGPQPRIEAAAGEHLPSVTGTAAVPVTERRRVSDIGFRTKRFAWAASLLAAIAGLGAYQYAQRGVYQTDIGEQRTLNLPDGSTVTLNADSRVTVHYSDRDRTIELDEGQALFKVEKDPTRPFIVRSGGASVRAVGTTFDVYRKASGTTVTVVEGRVAVVPTRTLTPTTLPSRENDLRVAELLLDAGEQLTVASFRRVAQNSNAPEPRMVKPEVRPVKIAEATAWTEGLLIFDGAALSEVVAEFNRQNARRLVLDADKELSDLRISGTFPASGSERITRFLHERFGVIAHETDEEIVLARP